MTSIANATPTAPAVTAVVAPQEASLLRRGGGLGGDEAGRSDGLVTAQQSVEDCHAALASTLSLTALLGAPTRVPTMVTKVIARGGTEFGVERTDTRVRIENKLNGLVARIERVANELLLPVGESYDAVFVKRDEGFRILEHKRYGGDKDSNKTNTLGGEHCDCISHAHDWCSCVATRTPSAAHARTSAARR